MPTPKIVPRSGRSYVLLAGSAGGHLDLLLAVAPEVVDGRAAVWVTSRTSRGAALGDLMPRVALLPEYGRNPLRALANLAAAIAVIVRYRPRVVITAGAGVVVPLCLLARLSGSRILYVETMARVSSPSRTARLLARLAERAIVQWPELQRAIPHAVVCRPLLLEQIPEGERPDGEGTFVAVGTHEQPFARLIGYVEAAAAGGVLPAPVFVQSGPASTMGELEGAPFLTAQELQARVRDARIVVCHGGAGIVSTALAAGRTPIVVPRRAALAEHIDDHQYQLARKLAEWGLVVLAETGIGPEQVARALDPLTLPAELSTGPSIADTLRASLEAS